VATLGIQNAMGKGFSKLKKFSKITQKKK